MLGDQIDERCGEVAREAMRLFRERLILEAERAVNRLTRMRRLDAAEGAQEVLDAIRSVN